MENNIARLLDEEIEQTILDVHACGLGSEEAKAALSKLGRLHDQRVKELELKLREQELIDKALKDNDDARLRKAELDLRIRTADEELEAKSKELELKKAELKEAKKSRWWRTLLEVAGIAAPIGATGYWLYKGMKFEEEGKIYSSRTSQWLSGFSRLFRKG